MYRSKKMNVQLTREQASALAEEFGVELDVLELELVRGGNDADVLQVRESATRVVAQGAWN